MSRRLATCGIAVMLSSAALPARAAELTEVVDAFDVENDNPADFHLEPAFRHEAERGRITREAGCGPSVDPVRCPEEQTVFNRELDFTHVTSALDIEGQLGLFRDLELHFVLPIVISQRRTLEYADGVTPEISTFSPSLDRINADFAAISETDFFGTYTYFDVPNDGRKRSGIGDIEIGIAWSPFSEQRNPHASTLTLGFDYTAPSGTPARRTNSGVGRGVHEIQLSILASRRLATWFDPYFGFRAGLPIASGNGLFYKTPNSRHVAPGAHFDVTFGTEVIMADLPERGQRYSFDLGFDFGYQLEGRDYTALFEALSTSPCNGLTPAEAGYGAGGPDGNAYAPDPDDVLPQDAACAWVVQQPANAQPAVGTPVSELRYFHDGITDVEGHASIGGHTGFNLQFSKYFELRLRLDIDYAAPHFLTVADAGRNADNDDEVDLNPSRTIGPVERNPNYNLVLDAVGRRIRVENNLTLGFTSVFAFQF